jgi:hypothetical protein
MPLEMVVTPLELRHSPSQAALDVFDGDGRDVASPGRGNDGRYPD